MFHSYVNVYQRVYMKSYHDWEKKRFAETIEEFSGHFGKSLVAEKKGGESPQGSRMQRH